MVGRERDMTPHPTLPYHMAATHDLRFKVAVDTAIKVKDVGKQCVAAAVETPRRLTSLFPLNLRPTLLSWNKLRLCPSISSTPAVTQFFLYIYLVTNLWTVTLFPTFGKDQWLKITSYHIGKIVITQLKFLSSN